MQKFLGSCPISDGGPYKHQWSGYMLLEENFCCDILLRCIMSQIEPSDMYYIHNIMWILYVTTSNYLDSSPYHSPCTELQ